MPSELSEEERQQFIRAGKISAEALAYGKSLIKPGMRVVDVLDRIEEKIAALGGACAFPPQISLNDVAAHACPDADDPTILEDQLIKLDLGAHVGGAVTDTAVTIDLSGSWGELVKATREALDAALKLVVPGTNIGDIGKTIQEVIQSHGFQPVRNLSGHGIGHFTIHTAPSIPNIDTRDQRKLEEGMTIAIEPFASTGAGFVYESGAAGVLMLAAKKPVRSTITREVLQHIGQYQGLPFARKWLTRAFGSGKTNFALRQLTTQLGILQEYPPLVDRSHGMVSQAEASVLIAEKPVVLTKV